MLRKSLKINNQYQKTKLMGQVNKILAFEYEKSVKIFWFHFLFLIIPGEECT
jgi:hypothetical protein